MQNIFDREALVKRDDIEVALIFSGLQRRIVIRTTDDRFVEDRGIGSNAGQSVVLDELLESALGDEAPREKVKPYRLTMVMQ